MIMITVYIRVQNKIVFISENRKVRNLMKMRKVSVHIQNEKIVNDLLSNLNYFAQIPRFKFGVKLQNISFFWNNVTK